MGAWDRWKVAERAAEDASGETEASAQFRAAGTQHDAFVLRLVHMRTSDPAIMAIKAAIVLNMWSGEANSFDHAVARSLEHDDFGEEPLSFSLMRDMLHQLGPAYRVMT